MPTIASQLDRAFRDAIHAAFGLDADPLVAPAQNEKFGDYQANAAMGLAKTLAEKTGQKNNPRQVAEQIKAKLHLGPVASEVSIAGPGFINVKLSPQWLTEQTKAIAPDPRLGIERKPRPDVVVVDYSGPNVAKQMHVGHLRSTIIGDAISRVLEFEGDTVIRQNHIGDWGTQFGMLIEYGVRTQIFDAGYMARIVPYDSPSVPATEDGSILAQLTPIRDLEVFYQKAKIAFDADQEFQSAARRRVVSLQSGSRVENLLWKHIVDETRRDYQPIYERLSVLLRPEHERGESFYNPLLPKVVADLKAAHIAKESEGATAVFVEGYESPLIIEKSGGGYLYGTTDLAAIRFRIQELHANRIIYTHDSRQAQHFAQVFATAKKAGWADNVSLEYAPFGTMLGEDNKPFKTRTGGTVKLKDLLDEAEERAYKLVTEKNPALPEEQRRAIAHAVGIGAVKYSDLSKDRTSDYVFSWDKMLSFDGNTAPYLQNAYVRIQGIFRKAKASDAGLAIDPAALRLEAPHELAVAKHVLRLGEVLDLVSRELKPHHLCNYLYELATRFHAFFEHCPVIQSDPPTRASRLALCDVTARTLALGLDLLGIEHPDQM